MINRQLLQQVANELHENMTEEQFRNYTLGLVLYKHLSRRMERHANRILEHRDFNFADLDESGSRDREILAVIRQDALKNLDFYISPADLFDTVATRGKQPGAVLLAGLTEILIGMNTAPDKDSDNLFASLEIDLGNTEDTKTALIKGIMNSLAMIEKDIQDAEDTP